MKILNYLFLLFFIFLLLNFFYDFQILRNYLGKDQQQLISKYIFPQKNIDELKKEIETIQKERKRKKKKKVGETMARLLPSATLGGTCKPHGPIPMNVTALTKRDPSPFYPFCMIVNLFSNLVKLYSK